MFCMWHLHGSCRGSCVQAECQRRTDTGSVVVRPQLKEKGENTGLKSKVIIKTQGGWGRKDCHGIPLQAKQRQTNVITFFNPKIFGALTHYF